MNPMTYSFNPPKPVRPAVRHYLNMPRKNEGPMQRQGRTAGPTVDVWHRVKGISRG